MRRQHRNRKNPAGVFFKVCMILAFCCAVIWFANGGTQHLIKWMYPIKYSDIVSEAAADFEVPEDIIYSVIRTESSFDPQAVSRAGAIGLMQLMPETYEWLLAVMGEELSADAIYYPEVNIRCGVYYLAYLKRELGEWETVFAAYNAGIGRVKNWLKDDRISEGGILINIPIEETANYVVKVAKAREMYQNLYEFK